MEEKKVGNDLEAEKKEIHKICWAIDIGTSRSGACFALPHAPNRFYSGIESKNQIVKVSTDILIKREDKKLVAFGEQAAQQYHNDEKANMEYALFEKFKMCLYNGERPLKHVPMIKSVCGTMEITVVEAFTYAFSYFLQNAKGILEKNVIFYEKTDIQWIITVPAIWSDGAKQVMIDAAKNADLTEDESKITICLEPTAASLWVFRTLGAQDQKLVTPQTKCLTVDAGGGTVDIMLFEVLKDQFIRKLVPESGGPWGSTYIDKEFELLLDKMFGQAPMDDFRKSQPSDYHRLIFTDFESVKLSEDILDPTKTFMLPITDLTDFLEKKHKINAEKQVKDCGADALGVSISRNKLKIPAATMAQFFQKQIKSIVGHIKGILLGHKDVKFIYMVGGFSNSNVLYNEIKKEFEQPQYGSIRVVRPPEPGGVILNGAALYDRSLPIAQNIVKSASYGIESDVPFDASRHKPEYRSGMLAQCCFIAFLKKGESYEVGHKMQHKFRPIRPEQEKASLTVYISSESDPIHITKESCEELATLNVPIPVPPEMKHASDEELLRREVTVDMEFLHERLVVTAYYSYTKDKRTLELDYFPKMKA